MSSAQRAVLAAAGALLLTGCTSFAASVASPDAAAPPATATPPRRPRAPVRPSARGPTRTGRW